VNRPAAFISKTNNEGFVKAFLLAAGHGTRLRPLTDRMPKCMVPICGMSMLEIWLEICRRAGVDEVLINLHAHVDIVREALDHNNKGVKVRVSEEPILLGSAGTVLSNREWVAHESSFWVFYADVLTTTDLRKMFDFHSRGRPIVTIGLYQVKDPKRCGVALFDKDLVVREFVEKPVNPKTNWAFSGLMLATPELLESIPARFPADFGFDVLPRLAGRMLAYPISDYLIDVGTMENYQAAQNNWHGLPLLEQQCS
jgi:mannose-1-phosphate guanylyltransferase